MIHGCLNGGTHCLLKEQYLCMNKIVYRRETRGTETSQYLQEKKEKSIPRVVASEIGRAQTKSRNTLGVEDYNNLSQVIAEMYWKSIPKRVKVQ